MVHSPRRRTGIDSIEAAFLFAARCPCTAVHRRAAAMGADQLGFRQGSIVSVRDARLTRSRRAARAGSTGSPPTARGSRIPLWTVAPEEGRRASSPLGRTWPAHRAGWHPPEALLWNRVSCRQTKCQSHGWKPTPTAACMNGEVCRDTGTVLVPVRQALGQRSRHTYRQLALP